MGEKDHSLFLLYSQLRDHTFEQKVALENVIENMRKDMLTNKAAATNDRTIKDMQLLQLKVNGLTLDLHKAEINKIKFSDPESLPEKYGESLLNKSLALFEELIKIRSMPTHYPNQIKSQQDKFQQFVEKLGQQKEIVNAFVDNAGRNFPQITERTKFTTLHTLPLVDLEKEKKVLEARIEDKLKMLDDSKNTVTKVSFRLPP